MTATEKAKASRAIPAFAVGDRVQFRSMAFRRPVAFTGTVTRRLAAGDLFVRSWAGLLYEIATDGHGLAFNVWACDMTAEGPPR